MSAPLAVWKFPIPWPGPDYFTIEMPAVAEILAVQVQHGAPHLWALVNPAHEVEERRFRIAGTGHPIAQLIEAYVGTFQVADGALVFHLFEVVAP